ncbi:MAG: M50 family metallopeptidase [Candidatus Colwellbacteria bacterium]|nr:M50 family metallopeptidase [Candidatus Colwellbacteria bacterium]
MFATTLLIIVFFAILILGHELGHFLAARILGMKVQEFGFGFPPKLWGKKIKGTEYTVNLIPFGGFVRIDDLEPVDIAPEDTGRKEGRAPIWKRAIVFSSGVVMNFFLAWLAFSFIFLVGVPKALYVSGTISGSPAESSGLKAGDRFIDFNTVSDLTDFIGDNPGKEVSLTVDRYGDKVSVKAIPEIKNGAEARIGVELIESGFPKQNFFVAMWSGFLTSCDFIWKILSALFGMFRHGDFSSSSGPVGIFTAVSVAKDMGVAFFLQLLGVVSLNLMVINAFPLPALDGGHIVFLIIEKIRRKPISLKVQSAINSTSFVLLLILMFVVTIKDVIGLF